MLTHIACIALLFWLCFAYNNNNCVSLICFHSISSSVIFRFCWFTARHWTVLCSQPNALSHNNSSSSIKIAGKTMQTTQRWRKLKQKLQRSSFIFRSRLSRCTVSNSGSLLSYFHFCFVLPSCSHCADALVRYSYPCVQMDLLSLAPTTPESMQKRRRMKIKTVIFAVLRENCSVAREVPVGCVKMQANIFG